MLQWLKRNDSMITVEKLTKVYKISNRNKGMFIAIDQVDFHIEEGKITGLIGLNGAGKSTIIKRLTGILTPTDGKIIYKNNIDQNRKSFLKQIGVMLSQKSCLFYDVPVKYSIDFYKKLYGTENRKNEELINTFIKKLNVDPLLEQPVRKLSFGQRIKCELIVAIINIPKILFLDEPTIGVDIKSKKEIEKFLRYLNEEYGTTIIYTSHDLNSIEELCHNLLILDHGRVTYQGDSKSFKNRKEYKIVEIEYKDEFDFRQYKIIHQDEMYVEFLVSKKEIPEMIHYLLQETNVVDFNLKTPDLDFVLEHGGLGDEND